MTFDEWMKEQKWNLPAGEHGLWRKVWDAATKAEREAGRKRWEIAAAKVLCEPGSPDYRDALRAALESSMSAR